MLGLSMGMSKFLHTMYRITDPDRSRAFFEALGMEFRRDLPSQPMTLSR